MSDCAMRFNGPPNYCPQCGAKLAAIGMWVAHELSCECGLDGYLGSMYGSMKAVAKLHDDAIMEMLEWFEPQVKRYYETWLAGDGDD